MVELYIRKLATDENESAQVSVVLPGALVQFSRALFGISVAKLPGAPLYFFPASHQLLDTFSKLLNVKTAFLSKFLTDRALLQPSNATRNLFVMQLRWSQKCSNPMMFQLLPEKCGQ